MYIQNHKSAQKLYFPILFQQFSKYRMVQYSRLHKMRKKLSLIANILRKSKTQYFFSAKSIKK